MKKIVIAAAVIIIAGVGIAFYYAKPSSTKAEVVTALPQPPVNEYPNMSLIMTDGTIRSTRDLPGSSILFLYFPDCDHCQREATAFRENLKSFEKYQLWFISTADYQTIEWFAKEFKLTGYANVHFVRTEMQDVINNFGGIPTPSVYIFSEAKRFVKAFNGETKIEEILKHL